MDEQTKHYLSERHFDVDKALALVAGNEALYFRLLRIFAEDAPASYEQYRDGLERGDLEAAQRASHSIKGNSGNLHMESLFKASTAVNDLLKQGVAPDASTRAAFEEEYAYILDTIAGLENLE